MRKPLSWPFEKERPLYDGGRSFRLNYHALLLAVLMGKLNVDNTTQDNRSALHKLFGTRKISSVLVIIFDDYNSMCWKIYQACMA